MRNMREKHKNEWVAASERMPESFSRREAEMECRDLEWNEMMKTANDLFADGESIYKMLEKSCPENAEMLVCPGHMGDTLVIASLGKAYKEQHHIKALIFVIVTPPEELLCCFEGVDAVLPLDRFEMNCLDFYMQVKNLWYHGKIRLAHFREEYLFNCPRLRMRNVDFDERCSFLESRWRMLDLNGGEASPLSVPPAENREELERQYGHAVLLMPVSYSANLLPDYFWEKLTIAIRQKGYDVYTNYNGAAEETVINGTEPLSTSFYEFAQLTGVFALFVGLRSGLCDLISLTRQGELVVLYADPKEGSDTAIRLTDERMNESNIYDLGRREGIECFYYNSEKEEELIDQICKKLP